MQAGTSAFGPQKQYYTYLNDLGQQVTQMGGQVRKADGTLFGVPGDGEYDKWDKLKRDVLSRGRSANAVQPPEQQAVRTIGTATEGYAAKPLEEGMPRFNAKSILAKWRSGQVLTQDELDYLQQYFAVSRMKEIAGSAGSRAEGPAQLVNVGGNNKKMTNSENFKRYAPNRNTTTLADSLS